MDAIKCTNIHIKKRRKEREGKEKIFKEIMAKNFPKLTKSIITYRKFNELQKNKKQKQKDPQIDTF